jgi:trk system potassium uptake protein TrkH
MPISQNVPISFIDCLFTSASAACITGACTVDLNSFSLYGKSIILIIIQISGIGLITFTLFMISIFLNLGFSTQLMAGQIMDLKNWIDAKKIIVFIVLTTIITESLGSFFIYLIIKDDYNTKEAIFNAIFHSISTFCSAGFSIFGNSMVKFQNNFAMLFITSILIILGTIGFLTLYEIFSILKAKYIDKKNINSIYNKLSLTSKIVIHYTTISIFIIFIILISLEYKNFQGRIFTGIYNFIFNTIAYRSTGITTIDLKNMHVATIFLIIIYSFIGSSPLSTGGGMKITTFSIFIATIKSVLQSKSYISIKEREIPQDQVFKAISVLSLSLIWLFISTFLLLLIEENSSFIDIFFETVSSFTTLGLATDLTPYLSTLGKILIIINMIFGRIGSLTLILALKTKSDKLNFHYPKERILIN